MGHANISITLNHYAQPMSTPGSKAEAPHLLDAYLAQQRQRRAA